MLYDIIIDSKNYRLELDRADGRWSCLLDGRELEVDAVLVRADVLSLCIGNLAYEIKSERVANDLQLWVGSTRFAAEVRDPRSLRGRARTGEDQGPKKNRRSHAGQSRAPFGQRRGTKWNWAPAVAVVEAMKMQNEIKSPKKGTVQKILITEGAAVNAGEVLAIVE